MTTGMVEEIETLTETKIERCLFEMKGDEGQPILVFICGIHGNEPMSIKAMQEVSRKIKEKNIEVKGSLVGISGNRKALSYGKRFIDKDLNRMWTSACISSLEGDESLRDERLEMKEIWGILSEKIKEKGESDFVVYDLHTTSSPSVPFITINDTISNREIAKAYPVATVFGIEEYLEGPLLSYMNQLGYNAIGFEGGQHDDIDSLYNHEAFIWLSLANHEMISNDLDIVKRARKKLCEVSKDSFKFFEITYRYLVNPKDNFNMESGFRNFQKIKKKVLLAVNNNEEIHSEWEDRIFMPLYQKQGDDGFFIIRRIPQFFLWLSKALRDYNFERFLLILPGISLYDNQKHILKVNNKTVRFLRKEVFHLLGFRQKVAHDDKATLYIRREKQ